MVFGVVFLNPDCLMGFDQSPEIHPGLKNMVEILLPNNIGATIEAFFKHSLKCLQQTYIVPEFADGLRLRSEMNLMWALT